MTLVCHEARPEDFPALQQMLEFYQYELSDIWHQDTDAACRYGYELSRHREGTRFHAYVARRSGAYVGLALVAPAVVTRTTGFWMEQFFVMKRFRREGVGRALARAVFAAHPGAWEVGQLPANVRAQRFWRQVTREVAADGVAELQVTEGWWHGVVQQFDVVPSG